MIYVRYDPYFRNITGIESGTPELGPVLQANGVPHVQMDLIPGPMEDYCIGLGGELYSAIQMPESIRIPDQTADEDTDTVPEFPDLPTGGVVEPASGTLLKTGDNLVMVRAPWYKTYGFRIYKWSPADEKRRLVAWAANHRWEREVAGAPYLGHRVATDDRSKILMMGSVMASQMIPDWKTTWQFLDGGEAELTGADVAQMSLMAQSYVNNLFDTFGKIKAKINSGEVTQEDEITAAFAEVEAAQDVATRPAAPGG